MKLTFLLFLLGTTLSCVYSFNFFHKKGNAQVSSSYQAPLTSRVPAEIFLEVQQSEPQYSSSLAVPNAPSFDIFSIIKNKFARNVYQEQPVVTAPLQQRPLENQCTCYPNTYYVQPQQSYQTQAYGIPSSQYAPVQFQSQVFTLPLQSENGGKFNIFSKIKSHFSGKKSRNGAQILVSPKIENPIGFSPLDPIHQQVEEPTTKPL